ncbi:MAG: TIGR04084 family radical SAM/SPASM domain-containing protein [Candidatus Heimdallarchaeota archaeon]
MKLTTNYFIILTRRCNLQCKYCGEDATFEQPPIDLAYPIDELISFLKQDVTDITIQFYGGEPLLKIQLMEKIMDSVLNVTHWSVQTNATPLHKVPPSYLSRLSAILASIDGRRETTDFNRGKGIYDKVLANCSIAREKGFTGDLVARMTASEIADIYEEVVHLANLQFPKFDHIHWQLDSQWDDDIHARWNDFSGWIDSSYNPGITKLIHWWLEEMKQGRFIGLVPFIPVMKSILFDQPSDIRCGAGLDSFAINPDGSITVCPISPEFAFSLVGHIKTSTPSTIRNSMRVDNSCLQCDDFQICGGRCLFINKTKLWGEELYVKVCGTVSHLITELRSIKDEVLILIQKGVITKQAFVYPEYFNGCEIIP